MELEVVDGGLGVNISAVTSTPGVDIEVAHEPLVSGVALAVAQGARGFTGDPGPPGPEGPTGPAATTSGYEHAQVTPAATWTVTHTLGRYPLSCEITVDGELVFSDVDYPDVFTVVVTFASPQAGFLRLI